MELSSYAEESSIDIFCYPNKLCKRKTRRGKKRSRNKSSHQPGHPYDKDFDISEYNKRHPWKPILRPFDSPSAPANTTQYIMDQYSSPSEESRNDFSYRIAEPMLDDDYYNKSPTSEFYESDDEKNGNGVSQTDEFNSPVSMSEFDSPLSSPEYFSHSVTNFDELETSQFTQTYEPVEEYHEALYEFNRNHCDDEFDMRRAEELSKRSASDLLNDIKSLEQKCRSLENKLDHVVCDTCFQNVNIENTGDEAISRDSHRKSREASHLLLNS